MLLNLVGLNEIVTCQLIEASPGTRLHERCLKEGSIEEGSCSRIEKLGRFFATSTCWINNYDFDNEELL